MREILPNIDWDFIWISFCAGVPSSIESEWQFLAKLTVPQEIVEGV
jgi:hypothetical protein